MKYLLTLLTLLCLCYKPATATVVVTNGLTHKYDMAAATAQKGYVMLQNVSNSPQRILVYQKDLRVACADEQMDVTDGATTERSNAGWLKLALKERVLAPGEKYSLTYEIVPPASELSGSYWSLLMVEVKKPIDTASLGNGLQVTSNVRYAIQVITNFQDAAPVDVVFEDVKVHETTTGKMLQVRLANKCNLMVQPQVKLEVYDGNGEIMYSKKADAKKLYPAQCRNFSIPIEDIPSGKYQAVIVADCGESDLFGMTVNLDVDE